MATVIQYVRERTGVKEGLIGGVIAGVIGGIIFALWGLLSWTILRPRLGLTGKNIVLEIAALVGSSSPTVGLAVHLAISALFGVGFALALGPLARTTRRAVAWGMLYGVALWIIGPLLIMPLLLGQGVLLGTAFTASALINLIGHLIYGVVTGLAYARYRRRSRPGALPGR